jgi:hypothetical protein
MTSGKPIAIPAVIGSLKIKIPKRTAIAVFQYVTMEARVGPMSSIKVKKKIKAIPVEKMPSAITE